MKEKNASTASQGITTGLKAGLRGGCHRIASTPTPLTRATGEGGSMRNKNQEDERQIDNPMGEKNKNIVRAGA